MKVLAFNGSPNKNGNTFRTISIIADKLKPHGIETEIVQVGAMNLSACIGCRACGKVQNFTCPVFKDELTEIIEKTKTADGIILSSPVYFSGVTGAMKSFLDRYFLVCGVNGALLRHKVGASVVTVRRTGGMPTYHTLNHYLEYSEMIVPTSNYWNVIHGNEPGEVTQDDEGVLAMELLGENMAWIMKVINESSIEKPKRAEKVWTSFIR